MPSWIGTLDHKRGNEAKTHGGFAEGMFTVEPVPASGLGGFTYRIATACPKGFKSRGRFKITHPMIDWNHQNGPSLLARNGNRCLQRAHKYPVISSHAASR